MAMQFFRSRFFSYSEPLQIDEPVAPIDNPATVVDRTHIAARNAEISVWDDMVSYDRTPVADEWAESPPDGAFVRVFVINEFTTVRVLHSASGERIADPAIDTWRAPTTYVAAP